MRRKRLRVLALCHKDLVPPEDVTGLDTTSQPWRTEFDVTVTLADLGHTVTVVGVQDELTPIRRTLEQFRPQIVFNLLEEFHSEPLFDQHVVSYLELLRVPYTGCNPRGLLLCRDKALSKKILLYHRVPVPEFHVFPRGVRVRCPRRLSFPAIVKSTVEEASLGISQASVVTNDKALADRVAFVHEKLGTDAIAERYIEGRELYLGILGNRRLQVLPPWELVLDRLPDGAPRIATARVKWDFAYQRKHAIVSRRAADLPAGVEPRLAVLAKRIYRVLHMNGYGRIDLRLDGEGRIYILEANPNPQLAFGEDFAESAEAAGLTYPQLLQRILDLGLRWAGGRVA